METFPGPRLGLNTPGGWNRARRSGASSARWVCATSWCSGRGTRSAQGSVALSLCTTTHPLHTIFTNISSYHIFTPYSLTHLHTICTNLGASASEATVRPDPRSAGSSPGTTCCASRGGRMRSDAARGRAGGRAGGDGFRSCLTLGAPK
jgi:hypothetical protein